jgi:photosystem II stability/assembly factor-like uncharacterized protein
MRALAHLIAASLLCSAGCRSHNGVGDSAPAVGVDQSMTKGRSTSAIVPAVQQLVVIDGETAIVFPGNLGTAVPADAGDYRLPLVTGDGGDTWNTLTSRTDKLDRIDFIDRSQGWLVNDSSELSTTTDGGATWSRVSRIEDQAGPLPYCQQITFSSPMNGWALGLDSLWQTQDGGLTWSRHSFPSLVSFLVVRGGSCWVASQSQDGRDNSVYRSRDMGQSWEEGEVQNTVAVFPNSNEIRALFFIDEQTGWLANELGIYRTEDAGSSWNKQLGLRKSRIESLFFLSQVDGWAAGWAAGEDGNENEPVLFGTADGGATWHRLNVGPVLGTVEKVFFPDANRGWLLLTQRVRALPEDSFVYHTLDGGKRWRKVLSIKSPYAD